MQGEQDSWETRIFFLLRKKGQGLDKKKTCNCVNEMKSLHEDLNEDQ